MYNESSYPVVTNGTLHAINRWAQEGIDPGDFAMSILKNDLMEAVRLIGDELRFLPDIIRYVQNEIPTGVWGSARNINEWGACCEIHRAKQPKTCIGCGVTSFFGRFFQEDHVPPTVCPQCGDQYV